MVVEYDSIVQYNVWDVVPRPENKSVVSSHWLYKVKQVVDGSVEYHKARFVAHGFSQVAGINYDETFSLVSRLKHAHRAWYTKIDNYFSGLGFTKSEVDSDLYHIMVEGKQLIIVLYVEGLILTVWKKNGELFVSKGKYVNEILRRFHMEKCKPMQTPLVGNWRKKDATSGEVVEATMYKHLVGSLMYLVNTQPNLCYAVNQLSQAMLQPTNMFWKEAKHVLRYLRGTS
eukprot:PITA_17561